MLVLTDDRNSEEKTNSVRYTVGESTPIVGESPTFDRWLLMERIKHALYLRGIDSYLNLSTGMICGTNHIKNN